MVYLILRMYNWFIFSKARLRSLFWGIFLKGIGKKVYIFSKCQFKSPHNIEIGSFVNINHDVVIGGQGGVKIGNYVLIGNNVNILSSQHRFDLADTPIHSSGVIYSLILIEDDVWIGCNAVILPGVRIGKGAIVGANAVVTRDVLPFEIVGGVPAKHIRFRFEPEVLEKLIS